MPNNFFPGLALYVFWNLITFSLVMVDKRRAKRDEWRIRERTFFLWAGAFGAAGIFFGMRIFRHKTQHVSFVLGIPILCLLNLVCGYFLWRG